MTVGGRQYNEAEMLQMQKEAEARVREMQNHARQVAGTDAPISPQPQYNNNWSQNPGVNRRRPRWSIGWPPGQGVYQGQQNRPPQPPPHRAAQPEAPPPEAYAPSGPPPDAPPLQQDGTIIGDIMAALKLDEDYLLIIGLILILVNQRADTTLILALAYLLI